MMQPMSKAEAARQAEHSQSITAFFGMILGGEEPGVIGSVLAELMSAFLVSHTIKTDARRRRSCARTCWRNGARQCGR